MEFDFTKSSYYDSTNMDYNHCFIRTFERYLNDLLRIKSRDRARLALCDMLDGMGIEYTKDEEAIFKTLGWDMDDECSDHTVDISITLRDGKLYIIPNCTILK